MPAKLFGLFVTRSTPGMIMPVNSEGVLRLGGAIGRYNQVMGSGPQGRCSLAVDNPWQKQLRLHPA